MNQTIILFTRSISNWINVVRTTVASFGILVVTFSKDELLKNLVKTEVELVIIEVHPEIEDVTKLILEIKHAQKNTKVIVAASSPTWEDMLLYGHAGAIDSIHKTLDSKKLEKKIEGILDPGSGEN